VESNELNAMLGHARINIVMQAINYEDNRPKEKPKGKR